MKIHTLIVASILSLHAFLTPRADAKDLPAEKIEKAVAAIKKKDAALLKQPTLLAYKTALFLSTQSIDTPTNGKSQEIKAKFDGGEGTFNAAVVVVVFHGYADDSTAGESFTIQLKLGKDETWEITKIDHMSHGRGDHK